jgi:hypothetical protein
MLDTLVKTESPERELVVADRCDRCGAQAYVQAVKGNQDLLFCGHHGRFHTPALVHSGWVVLDSTDKINKKPTDPDPDQF